jgi:Protein of unknown function (DUF2975)
MYSRYFVGMNETQTNSTDGFRMRRIKSASTILRGILLAGLIVEGAAVTAGGLVLLMTIFHPATLRSHTAFLNCGVFILSALALMVTLNFFRLFTRLKDAHLFDGKTISYLEQAGKWWIVLGIAQMIFRFADAHIFSHQIFIPEGNGIFCGLAVFFIAWVLREGQKLKEEQELTV